MRPAGSKADFDLNCGCGCLDCRSSQQLRALRGSSQLCSGMAKPTRMFRKTAPKDAAKDARRQETAAGQALRIRVLPSIGDIAGTAWDACAGGAGANPFTRHAFLSALEASKSATARTGWQPQHLVAETADGSIIGVAPCYLKSHSRGEYVFDRGWAEAYERAGGCYYPKLQVAVPFTPAMGRRLIAAPGADVETAQAALAQGLIELCRLREASSAHVTFMTQAEWRALG